MTTFLVRKLLLWPFDDWPVVLHQTQGRPVALDSGRRGGKERGKSMAGKANVRVP